MHKQTVAALEKLDRLIGSAGEKDCLLTLKTHFLLNLGELEKARQANDKFLAKAPKHPMGFLHRAMIFLGEARLNDAVNALQDAMDAVKGTTVPVSIGNAYRLVGLALLRTRAPYAARAHFGFARSLRSDDQQTNFLLQQSYQLPMGSVMLKHDIPLPKAPIEPLWSRTYQQVRRLAVRGQWRMALRYLDLKMLPEHPHEAVLHKAIAVLAMWLNNSERAIAAWRAYADCAGVTPEQAAEAQVWILYMVPAICSRTIDSIVHSATINDMERVLAQLQESRRASDINLPPATNDQPAPKAAFAWLDKPEAELTDDFSFSDIPEVVCELLVFGRQTDRPPRLEFRLWRDCALRARLADLKEFFDGAVDTSNIDTDIFRQVDEQTACLNWYWHLPPETSKSKLIVAELEKASFELTEHWTQIPFVLLDDKTPAEVADDPQYKTRLEALISQFETSDRNHPFNKTSTAKLRQRLGMPPPETIDPTVIDPKQLSPMRLNWVDWSKCSDDDLAFCLFKSIGQADRVVTEPIGREALSRPSLQDRIPMDEVCGVMANVVIDDATALEYIRRARRLATAKGKSPGVWLVAELELRIGRGILDKTEELFEEIQTRHMHEPAVSARMARLLASMGVYDTESPERAGEPTEHAAIGDIQPPATDPAWTPEEQPAVRGGGKLWLPGDP